MDEASRLAVTATAADLEDWARSVAVHGQVDLADLVGVLDAAARGQRPAALGTSPPSLHLAAS